MSCSRLVDLVHCGGRRLDHGFLAPRPPVDELRKPAGPVTGVGIEGLHMRPFVAFRPAHTAHGCRCSDLQSVPPSNPEARSPGGSGVQFTTDFGRRARTPCRLSSHQPRKGASRMLRSLMAKRCRYQARPRGTCFASARRSPANSRLKPNRGYSWITLSRTASGISLLRRPNTSTAAPADRRYASAPDSRPTPGV